MVDAYATRQRRTIGSGMERTQRSMRRSSKSHLLSFTNLALNTACRCDIGSSYGVRSLRRRFLCPTQILLALKTKSEGSTLPSPAFLQVEGNRNVEGSISGMTGRTSNTKRSLMSASSSSEAAASTSISANKSRTELSKRTKRRQRREAADLEEEERLTNLLFTTDGSAQHDDGPLQRRPWKEQAGDGETSLFTFDRTGDPSVDRDDLEKASESESILEDGAREDSATKAHDSAAWVDQDDEVIRVDILETSRLRKLRNSRLEATDMTGKQLESRLRKQFRTTTELTARTDWARVEKADGTAVESEGEKTDEELVNVSSSAPLLVPTCDRPSLPANTLDIVRCPDANLADPNSAVIQSVNFHPASDSDRPLLLTAGLDKTLRFFQVGEEKSTKVHGIHCTSARMGAKSCEPSARPSSRNLVSIFTRKFRSCQSTLRRSWGRQAMS